MADLVMKMEVSSQQHQLSTESLQSSLRRQEGRTRSLQEDLAAVKETLRARDEEFENYKVRIVLCVTEYSWSCGMTTIRYYQIHNL